MSMQIAWSMHEQPVEQDERHAITYKDGEHWIRKIIWLEK